MTVFLQQEEIPLGHPKVYFDELTNIDSEVMNEDFDTQFQQLLDEMYALKDELSVIEQQSKLSQSPETLNEISTIIQGLKNHPVEYNDQIVRQLIHSIKVISKTQVEVYFKDGGMIQVGL